MLTEKMSELLSEKMGIEAKEILEYQKNEGGLKKLIAYCADIITEEVENSEGNYEAYDKARLLMAEEASSMLIDKHRAEYIA